MSINAFKLIGSRIFHHIDRHVQEMHHYRSAFEQRPSPIGRVILLNEHIPEEKIIGFHGGCATKWIDQASKVQTIATNGGLYVGCAFVAESYARDQKEPVIIKLAADVVADRDHSSGIGAHFHVPEGTPVFIKSIHEVNPEYLDHLCKINNISKPSLLAALKTDPIIRGLFSFTIPSDKPKKE